MQHDIALETGFANTLLDKKVRTKRIRPQSFVNNSMRVNATNRPQLGNFSNKQLECSSPATVAKQQQFMSQRGDLPISNELMTNSTAVLTDNPSGQQFISEKSNSRQAAAAAAVSRSFSSRVKSARLGGRANMNARQYEAPFKSRYTNERIRSSVQMQQDELVNVESPRNLGADAAGFEQQRCLGNSAQDAVISSMFGTRHSTEDIEPMALRSTKTRMLTLNASGMMSRTMQGGQMAKQYKSKDAVKKRLMSAYQVKSKLKENPTLRFNLDLEDSTNKKQTKQAVSQHKKVEMRQSIAQNKVNQGATLDQQRNSKMSSTLSYTKHAMRLMDPTTLESINAEF